MKNTISDMNWLFDGFRKSMKGSSWKEEPQRFEIDFLSELTKLSKELDGRTYKPSARSEFILNERGKTRYKRIHFPVVHNFKQMLIWTLFFREIIMHIALLQFSTDHSRTFVEL